MRRLFEGGFRLSFVAFFGAKLENVDNVNEKILFGNCASFLFIANEV